MKGPIESLPQWRGYRDRVLGNLPGVLRSLREQGGYTQKSVAWLLGVERSTYGRYELGSSLPGVDTLAVLALFYGVPLSWFVQGEEVREPGPKRRSRGKEEPLTLQLISPQEAVLVDLLRRQEDPTLTVALCRLLSLTGSGSP